MTYAVIPNGGSKYTLKQSVTVSKLVRPDESILNTCLHPHYSLRRGGKIKEVDYIIHIYLKCICDTQNRSVGSHPLHPPWTHDVDAEYIGLLSSKGDSLSVLLLQ